MVTSRTITDLVLELGDFEIRIDKQEAYRLGLFLTGHNWGTGEGKVRYMGSLAQKCVIKFKHSAYPDHAVVDYYVDSQGRHTDEITFVLSPSVNLKSSRDAVALLINKYLAECGDVQIPFPSTYLGAIDNNSSREPVFIPSGKDANGKTYSLSIGFYLNHVGATDTKTHHGIFHSNQSVSRPPDVRKLVLADRQMNDG